MIATPPAPAPALYHDSTTEPRHRCEARILARCAICATEYPACTLTDEAVVLLRIGAWACRACSERLTAGDVPGLTTVVNVRESEFDVYIGRKNRSVGLPASKWANRFRIGPGCTREQAIARYREDFPSHPELVAAVRELRGKRLGCWCKEPHREVACHGDFLAEQANAIPVCGRYPSDGLAADLARVHGVIVLPCHRLAGHAPGICAHLTQRIPLPTAPPLAVEVIEP
jgi:hypothetical protein